MERRWTTRTRMRLDVDIAYGDDEHVACTTRDVGLGGVFVEGSCQLPPEGEGVELTFRLGSGVAEHRIRAKVVRVCNDGIGLMFRDFDATAFRSLQKVMRFKEQDVAV